MSYSKTRKIGLIAPGDLATKGGYSVKVYLEADILSEFGKVTLYGFNLKHSDRYECHDLTRIAPFSQGVRKSLKVFLSLCSTIIKSKFEYVFLPTVFNPLFPLLFIASKIAGSKVIYDFRDPLYGTMTTMKDEVNSRTGNRLLTWLMIKLSFLIEAFLIRSSDYIMTVSPLLVEYVKRFTHKSPEDIFLYYNYVPSEVKHINDSEMPASLQRAILDKVVICYLGHIQTAIRGIENIIKVLKESRNKNVFLVLLGEIDNKPYWDSLIVDPMPKPEALGYLSRCDYAILGPSPDNALPAKIFDTLSMGIKFILPANMTSAIEVLGNYSLTYNNYPDLIQLFNKLNKPARAPSMKEIENKMRQYSLNLRLNSIFHGILESNFKSTDSSAANNFTSCGEFQSPSQKTYTE